MLPIPDMLEIVVPIATLILIILSAALIFLIEKPDATATKQAQGTVLHTESTEYHSSGRQTVSRIEKSKLALYENYNLHRWVQLIQRAYWNADRKIREMLKAKGWEWS